MVNKVVSKSPFDAQVAIVERLAWSGAGDFDNPFVADVQIQLAADAAKITGRSNFFTAELNKIFRSFLFDQSTGWTSINTSAAKFARSINQTSLPSRSDRSFASSTRKCDCIDGFDFVTVPRAASA